MSQETNLSILSQQTASYTTTGAFVNIPQFVITVPEDGNYNIRGGLGAFQDTAADSTYLHLAINGSALVPKVRTLTGSGTGKKPYTPSIDNIPLKLNDVVSIQAMFEGSATEITYESTYEVGFLQIIKVGV